MAERPTEDLYDPRPRRGFRDSQDIPRGGGVLLPRYFPFATLLAIFGGIAAGASWSVSVSARVEALEKATDIRHEDSFVSRHARRLGGLEAQATEAAKQSDRIILVLCSLCKGLPKADCAEACKPGR